MLKTINKVQKGFTIIELLIVIAIIAILAGLVLNNFQGAQAKARDTQRVTRVNAIHSKLEEYFNEANSYPSALALTNFPGIDAKATTDPRGGIAQVHPLASIASPTPAAATGSGNEFKYYVQPAACSSSLTTGTYTSTTVCTGYALHSFIERPTTTTPSPYVKLGLQNP